LEKSYACVKERLLGENWRNRTGNRMGKMRMKKNPRILKWFRESQNPSGIKLVKDVNGNKKPAAST